MAGRRRGSSVAQPCLAVLGCCLVLACPGAAGQPSQPNTGRRQSGHPWARHVIDQGARGPDGVKLADLNGDGLLDIAVGYEQGGLTRVCIHPGPRKVKQKWPAVTVGRAPSVEDATFVDLDGDGALEVVSSTQGASRTMFVHWAPKDRTRLLDPAAWLTQAIPATSGRQQWMFCLPMDIDANAGIDLVCGSKNQRGSVGWLESPASPRDLSAWKWHELRAARWIMSLVASDMDGDGDLDILGSDRKGPEPAAFWLENPGHGNDPTRPWKQHEILASARLFGRAHEIMFLAEGDLDQDRLEDVVVAVKPRLVVWCRRMDRSGTRWEHHLIEFPDLAGTSKGVAVADVNLDGRCDLVVSCEEAGKGRLGVLWLEYDKAPTDRKWRPHNISGPVGVKYDLVETSDLDQDGDLDVITTEEIETNAVVWYENPTR